MFKWTLAGFVFFGSFFFLNRRVMRGCRGCPPRESWAASRGTPWGPAGSAAPSSTFTHPLGARGLAGAAATLEEAGHPRSRRPVRKGTAVIPEAVTPEEANLFPVLELAAVVVLPQLDLGLPLGDWVDVVATVHHAGEDELSSGPRDEDPDPAA